LKVLHYLNQFFGGLGGEEKANEPLRVVPGTVGPGRALQQALGTDAEIVATVVCGDNYFNEESDSALRSLGVAIDEHQPDLVVAGPALNAGRYGLACGTVCAEVQKRGIPAVTGMFPENPGVVEHWQDVYIVPTGDTPADMTDRIGVMANLGLKLARREALRPASEDGYMPRGVRKGGLRSQRGAKRAAEMLAARVNGRAYETELPLLGVDMVEPALFSGDLSKAKIGLVTCGGLVPSGNPDGLVRGGAETYHSYSIEGLDTLSGDSWDCIHRGFFTDLSNENPNYILPLDSLRVLEREGAIGEIHSKFLSTSGVGTSVAHSRKIGADMAAELKEAGVDVCVMVAT
jgi:betaine reductase